MPTLSLSKLGANGKAHDWSHVLTVINELLAFFNTTKIDYLNTQSNGLRVTNMRTHAGVEGLRVKVRNDTGAQLDANTIVYFSGTYNDGSNNYPTIAKAQSTNSNTTTRYGQAIVEANIADGSDGTVVIVKEVNALDTSAYSVGDRVFLSDTAGSYGALSDLPDVDYRVQVVGVVTVSDANVGRIVFGNWTIVPYSIAHEV